jgi:hypothetical protein
LSVIILRETVGPRRRLAYYQTALQNVHARYYQAASELI